MKLIMDSNKIIASLIKSDFLYKNYKLFIVLLFWNLVLLYEHSG